MPTSKPAAMIDIGSNSIRLVVYAGAPRIPSVIFNEKVLAGLGQGLAETGRLAPAPQVRALAALRRFRLLVDEMEVDDLHVLATAAVREASNGDGFLDEVRALGFDPEVISGEEEGRLAGLGVISGIPNANGLAGDLGGGSLELADVSGGKVARSISLPFGVLRIGSPDKETEARLRKQLGAALARTGLVERGRGRPFYMVGGSWRALARLDIISRDYPLPITHHYVMAPSRPAELRQLIAGLDRADPTTIRMLTATRIPTLPAAKLVLSLLVEALRPSELIVSSFGIREGYLFSRLGRRKRDRDPLIEAARFAGRGLSRFGEHGDLLDRWIAPIFPGTADARLRLAACLLADVAWAAHPDFRAERGVEMALHGNWVGIDAAGRVAIAQALFSNFGGGRTLPDAAVAALCDPDRLERAATWGLAMRLGQRLSGGLAATLERTRLSRHGDLIRLTLPKGEEALYGETVDRRLKKLASALGCRSEVAVG
ncbi:MAG: exopolyphosphatase / guanosine-5-triphosphate,3-diphosphate pyrophosphatase [Sphingomonadales bacterium]|jgi:exopolyphosphatase/guanosine-5'-triphosphate,3'-diphosphate pyrophosphatase|nr:exopolyphosphatase / guanosine-5-triphosphate,3-diphosphate pyrophosphatase [Sphingomonadales bacterium]